MDWFLYSAFYSPQSALCNMPHSPNHTYSHKHFIYTQCFLSTFILRWMLQRATWQCTTIFGNADWGNHQLHQPMMCSTSSATATPGKKKKSALLISVSVLSVFAAILLSLLQRWTLKHWTVMSIFFSPWFSLTMTHQTMSARLTPIYTPGEHPITGK